MNTNDLFQLKAVVFDFDGTLLATEELWYRVCADLFRSRGVELPFDDYLRCVGGSMANYDPYADLARKLGKPELRRALIAEAHAVYDRQARELELKDGALGVLDQALARGLRVAMASGSCAADIFPHLDRLGIRDRFEVICTADDVDHVKPHPALYIAALAGLGIQPGEGLAVEDSPHGAQAACDAGMACVAIPTLLTRGSTFDPRAIMCPALTELDLNRFV